MDQQRVSEDIHERENGDRYEAWAFIGGLKFSKIVYRDDTGWPYDYKQKAHDEIKRAAIRHRSLR